MTSLTEEVMEKVNFSLGGHIASVSIIHRARSRMALELLSGLRPFLA